MEQWKKFVFFPLPLSTELGIFSSKGSPPACDDLQVVYLGSFPPV
jgi:hypothetical protein